MSFHIDWQMYLQVSNRAAAERVIAKIGKALNLPVNVDVLEPYWKDDALWRVVASSPLKMTNRTGVTFGVLSACNNLARSWIVTGPTLADGGEIDFGGSANSDTIKIPGLHAILFHVAGSASNPQRKSMQEVQSLAKALSSRDAFLPWRSRPLNVVKLTSQKSGISSNYVGATSPSRDTKRSSEKSG